MGIHMHAYFATVIVIFSLIVCTPAAQASNRTGWVYHPDYLLHDAGPRTSRATGAAQGDS